MRTVGFTMVRNDPTKRRHGGISARFGLSACILVPPLLMAAGIAFFDAFAPQNGGPQPAAQPPVEQQAAAPQSIVAKRVSDFLRATNRMDKSIVFCEDVEHAEGMRHRRRASAGSQKSSSDASIPPNSRTTFTSSPLPSSDTATLCTASTHRSPAPCGSATFRSPTSDCSWSGSPCYWQEC